MKSKRVQKNGADPIALFYLCSIDNRSFFMSIYWHDFCDLFACLYISPNITEDFSFYRKYTLNEYARTHFFFSN